MCGFSHIGKEASEPLELYYFIIIVIEAQNETKAIERWLHRWS
jgi:hypothetical protein